MSPEDLRLFCTALGFTAVVMGGGEGTADDARRALGFAHLIEAFCKQTIPDLGAAADPDILWRTDKLIEEVKADLRDKGSADMHKDRATLSRLYERLRQRYAAYASDDMIADRVLELIDAEMENEEERK